MIIVIIIINIVIIIIINIVIIVLFFFQMKESIIPRSNASIKIMKGCKKFCSSRCSIFNNIIIFIITIISNCFTLSIYTVNYNILYFSEMFA